MPKLLAAVRSAVESRGGQIIEATLDAVVFSAGDREARVSLVELRKLADSATPAQIDLWVAERVDVTFRAVRDGPAPLALGDLLPRLRPPGERGEAWSTEIAGGLLILCLIADRPSSVRYLSPFDVVGLGVGLSAARAAALDNLRSLATQGRWVPAGEGLIGHRSQVSDGHDGTRVLIADQWFADPAGLLVLAPTRDIGFAVPVSTPGALTGAMHLHEVALVLVAEQPYPISAGVFWLHEGVLTSLTVADGPGAPYFVGLPPLLAQRYQR